MNSTVIATMPWGSDIALDVRTVTLACGVSRAYDDNTFGGHGAIETLIQALGATSKRHLSSAGVPPLLHLLDSISL